MNKPVYLELSILELSKMLVHEFWFDYVKPKYGKIADLCYMDTDSFIIYVKTDDIYKDIAEDVVRRFDTSNYELQRLLLKGKNKKLIDDRSEDKTAKGTKKSIIKKLRFENHKNCSEETQLENIINHLKKLIQRVLKKIMKNL